MFRELIISVGIKPLFFIITAWLLVGCSSFGEKHYYQLANEEDDVINYYRLSVNGYSLFSSARYISGYYDERAVDLFFNELKIKPTDPNSSDLLFPQQSSAPGEATKLTPLSPSDTHGAFLMIFSTNASSVTNAIGQFAENHVVADAITNLANRDIILAAKENTHLIEGQVAAASSELDALFTTPPDTQNQSAVKQYYIRILNSIAAAMGYSQSFEDFNDAQNWYIKETN